MSNGPVTHVLPVFDAGDEACFLVMETPDRPLKGHPVTAVVDRVFRRRFRRGVWQVDSDYIFPFLAACHPEQCEECAKGESCVAWDAQWLDCECYVPRRAEDTEAPDRGYAAFEFADAAGDAEDAAAVLGLTWPCAKAAIETEFRRLIAVVHPDKPGGDHERATAVVRARALLLQRLTAEV